MPGSCGSLPNNLSLPLTAVWQQQQLACVQLLNAYLVDTDMF